MGGREGAGGSSAEADTEQGRADHGQVGGKQERAGARPSPSIQNLAPGPECLPEMWGPGDRGQAEDIWEPEVLLQGPRPPLRPARPTGSRLWCVVL